MGGLRLFIPISYTRSFIEKSIIFATCKKIQVFSEIIGNFTEILKPYFPLTKQIPRQSLLRYFNFARYRTYALLPYQFLKSFSEFFNIHIIMLHQTVFYS